MALLRAWLKSGEASLLQRIVDVIEQASAMYEREHLEPNTHEHLETFEVWLRHRTVAPIMVAVDAARRKSVTTGRD